MPEPLERRKALRFSALRLLSRMLDETAFLSDFGVRSMSKFYGEHPYVFERAGHRFTISYVPGDSATERWSPCCCALIPRRRQTGKRFRRQWRRPRWPITDVLAYEMANLRYEPTGLPFVVFISQPYEMRHDVRSKSPAL
jgi:hypothetical protein